MHGSVCLAQAEPNYAGRTMKWRIDGDKGQDLVEYALVLPLFLLLFIGTIEFGLLFFQYTVITNAAREGARAGIARETTTCNLACVKSNINNAARAIVVGLDEDALIIEEPQFPNSGAQVSVTVRYQTGFMTQLLIDAVGGSGKLTLQSMATMQRE